MSNWIESSSRPLFPQWSHHVYPQFLPGSHPNHQSQQNSNNVIHHHQNNTQLSHNHHHTNTSNINHHNLTNNASTTTSTTVANNYNNEINTNYYHRDNLINNSSSAYAHIRNRGSNGVGGGMIKNGINNNFRFRSTPGIGQFMYG